MRRIALALAAMALLAACGQTADQDTQAPATARPNQADVTFTQNMIPHHQQAIEMAKLIQDRATRPELLKLAGDTITTRATSLYQALRR